jgi:acyl phosphate:glycerol-3-phosphate acyltransferase
MLTAAGLWVACYLVGAVPVGYVVARARGVDLLAAGSGNVGATNVGRVLGRKYGAVVFVLDFLKGAVPVSVAARVEPSVPDLYPSLLPCGAAVAAFVGHLFPVFLRFRGGKGVATGFGAVSVLLPGPALAAVAAWVIVVLVTRYVSVASVVAVALMPALRLTSPEPFAESGVVVTAFCLSAAAVVVVKHRTNARRLAAGTENRIREFGMRHLAVKALHLLALGVWVGGAGFFNFVAAPATFDSFREVVRTSPSDRTAGLDIVPPGTPDDAKTALAAALAGAAVGPVFPTYFAVQGACGAVALVTAVTWRKAPYGRLRVLLVAVGLLGVAVGKPVSDVVSRLRVERFAADPATAAVAKERFAPVHLVSLGLSGVTVLLAGAALVLAARLPENPPPEDK